LPPKSFRLFSSPKCTFLRLFGYEPSGQNKYAAE
jgi:hypothetical protein